jgi:hypothetical protein
LVNGLMFGRQRCFELAASKFDVYNIAPDGATSVRFIAAELIDQLGFQGRTKIHYGDSTQGWPGDVPQSRMAALKLRNAGFSLPQNSDEAVRFAIGRIIHWLANRASSGDGLRLPPDTALPGFKAGNRGDAIR